MPPVIAERKRIDDLDIFTNVGEYEGIEDDVDSEDSGTGHKEDEPVEVTASERKNVEMVSIRNDWFKKSDNEVSDERPATNDNIKAKHNELQNRAQGDVDVHSEPLPCPHRPQSPLQQLRLQPLASSSIQDISIILQVDAAIEAEEKRKAKKEKKRAKRKD